ncbi:DUF1304 domain-containing protein [Aestuariimicrobium soli]|uniref:DUF1304 domain-containing protein n=1 Tax=Aestuariimicrobium soli TaxID=2035834 RepID=UPI003EBF28A5
MTIIGLALIGLAALVHVYIFWMESFGWTSARVRATFGTSAEEAEATRELAYNQGFYNLFLAITVGVGIAFFAAGRHDVGSALALTGAGSMVAASLVLFASSPDKRGAALKQGLVPLVGIIALVIGLL